MTTAIIKEDIAPAWTSLQSAFPIYPIRNEAHYEKMLALMNALLDEVGDNESHTLANLLDLVGQLIKDYENEHHEIPHAAPHEVLRFIMDQHKLNQNDLAEEVGGQSVVSEILNGKREINVRQAKALANRFGVSSAVFLV